MTTAQVVRELLKEFTQHQGRLIERINNLPQVKRLAKILHGADDQYPDYGFDLYCRYVSPTEPISLVIKDALTESAVDYIDLLDVDAVLEKIDKGKSVFEGMLEIDAERKAKQAEWEAAHPDGVSMEEVLGSG